jgi:competence protein ComEA
MLSHRHSLVALTAGLLLLLFAASVPAGPVNINTADAATLARELTGIGLKRAQDIVAYRQKHGPFRSADELALVKGIGPSTIAKNRDNVRTEVKPAAGAKPAAAAKPAVKPPAGTSSGNR